MKKPVTHRVSALYPAQCVLALSLLVAAGAFADSLFTGDMERGGTTLAQKVNRFQEGDLVTVMVSETINANTTSDTNTKKEAGVKSEANQTDNEFLVANTPQGLDIMDPKTLPNWNIKSTNETKAKGNTQRKTSLSTEVTCTVVKVLPNGNVRLEGDKKLSMNREDSTVHVAGIARSKDILPGNTVQSSQLADAQILLKGKGPLWNNQRRGLLTRFLDWVSPF